MRKHRRPPEPTRKQQFETLLQDVGKEYLWGLQTKDPVGMAFSSGLLMGALTILHPTYDNNRLNALHKSILQDLEQHYDTFIAQGGISFIIPLDDEDIDQNEGDL